MCMYPTQTAVTALISPTFSTFIGQPNINMCSAIDAETKGTHARTKDADRNRPSHLLPPLEVRLEVGRPQPVRVVDVAAHLLPLAVHVSNEDDRGQLAVPNQLFSVPEGEQERGLAQVLVDMI